MEFDGLDSFLEAADSKSLSLTGDLTIPKPVDSRLFYRLESYPAPPEVVISESIDSDDISDPTQAGWYIDDVVITVP